jgi:hypothetical protein
MEITTKVNDSGETVTVYTCNVCNKEFGAITHLKLHMVNHLTEPKRVENLTFFCKICKQGSML